MKKGLIVFASALSMCLAACGGGNNATSGSSSVSFTSEELSSVVSSGTPAKEKYDFSEIGNLLASTSDANSFGIRTRDSKQSNLKRKGALSSGSFESKNIWVKTSAVYDSDTTVNEDGTIGVTFTETVTNESLDEVKVTKTIRLDYSAFDIEVISSDDKGILVSTENDREFRVVGEEDIILDWTTGEIETETIEEVDHLRARLLFQAEGEYRIETRSTNATYTFPSLEGDKYSLFVQDGDNQVPLYADVIDNGEGDSNEKDEMISFAGLVEGVDYEWTQVGTRYNVTVEQNQIDGVIDKLYTMKDFTLISFVPEGKWYLRPSNDELSFDDFGISNYDKHDYYSDPTRQSFVVANETGKIYKIENFRIRKIEGDLFYSDRDNLVYDIKIDENDNLVFYSLFSNSLITPYNAFKDKYGHRFIQNDKLNTYDAENDTTYYVYWRGNEASRRRLNYFLTGEKETFVINYNSEFGGAGSVENIYTIDENGQQKEITENDTFSIMYDYKMNESFFYNSVPLKVKSGALFIIELPAETPLVSDNDSDYYLDLNRCIFAGTMLHCFFAGTKERRSIECGGESMFGNDKLMKDDIFVFLRNRQLFVVYDILSRLSQMDDWETQLSLTEGEHELLLDDVDLDSETRKLMTYGLNGNVYYDFALVEKDGEKKVEVFKEGTRIEEPKIVVLQPIN